MRRTDARIALALLAASALLYLANRDVPLEGDAVPNVYLSASLLTDGDLVFDPREAPFMFVWHVASPQGQTLVNVHRWDERAKDSGKSYADLHAAGQLQHDDSRYFVVATQRKVPGTGEPLFASTFGPAAGLTALPALALLRAAGVDLWRDHGAVWMATRVVAAVLVAGSVALVYLTAAGFTTVARAVLLAAAYALGTCVWSISSQALWQQTPALFFLALGIWCLVRGESVAVRGAAAGLAFAVAVACRPTGLAVAAAAAAYLLVADRRALVAFVAAALPVAAALMLYNVYYFGSPLASPQMAAGAAVAQYKTGSPELWQTPLWVGAAGLLASPSRGLLVHSPFLAAAFAGAVLAWRDGRYARLRFLTVAVPLLWLPAFLWFDWWGGWSYGYRPIVDSMPLLAILCVPALDAILAWPLRRAAFAAAIAWSVLVQFVGAFAYTQQRWNVRAIDVRAGLVADVDKPEHRYRLWSLRDWQIGYFLDHFAESRAERRAETRRLMDGKLE
jgi:hypothetical protein